MPSRSSPGASRDRLRTTADQPIPAIRTCLFQARRAVSAFRSKGRICRDECVIPRTGPSGSAEGRAVRDHNALLLGSPLQHLRIVDPG